MKINKGKIKNINKKIFTGMLSFMLITVPLSGCTEANISEVSYVTNSEGDVLRIDGTVLYDIVKECKIYKISKKDNSPSFYVIALYERGWSDTHLYNIFTKQDYLTKDFILEEKLETLEYYLKEFAMVKEEYTQEDLNDVLNQFYESYVNTKNLTKKR